MKDDNFMILRKKEFYEFLEGSGPRLVEYNGTEYGMPYYTATELVSICTNFGCGNYLVGSRWNIVEALLDFAIAEGRVDELLRFFFSEERFSNLNDLSSMEEIDNVYKSIVKAAIDYINKMIRLSRREFIYTDGHFYIVETGKRPAIETPKLNVLSVPYVQGLRERCSSDLLSGNFDSVITKSRTMIEEVLVQILESNNHPNIPKGDIIKQYNEVKTLYGMQQSKEYDARVNSLLGGLERIVQSVAEMRNANSDAHGVGSRRINVRECEARLVMNASITFCEYILSDHGRESANH